MRKEKLFIPLTLDNSGRRFYGEWTWIKAMVLIALMLLFSGLWANLWWENRYLNFKGTIPFLIVTEFLNAYLWVAIIRFFVARERVLKKIYRESKEHRITDLSVLWGIYNIEDNKIMYVDGRCAALVCVSRGYLFGRPPGFEEEHFEKLSMFLRHLLMENYTIKYYNRMISDANIEPLKETEAIVSKNKASGIYYLESKTIKFIRELAPDIADTEKEYFLVGCQSVEQLSAMLTRIYQALEFLTGSLYTDIHIAYEREVYEFIQGYFGLTYIDVQRLIKTTFKKNAKQFVTVTEIIYADEDLALKKHAVEADTAYSKRATEEEERMEKESFDAMQEANKRALASEHEAKVDYVLYKRGVDLSELSSRKRKKLVASITPEELEDAATQLNKIRINNLYDKRELQQVDVMHANSNTLSDEDLL